MSELPDRPDLDQLRRQAKELLRAADGEPRARARLRAVSERVTLSAAQLAIAREHGFASWPALRAEAERRRQMSQPAARPPAGDSYGWPSPDRAADRWSFAGGAPLPVAAGVLSPRVLVIGPGHAALDASLMPSAETQHRLAGPGRARVPGLRLISALLGRRPADEQALRFDDVIVTDDREGTHTLSFESGHIPPARPGKVRGPIWLRLRLDPAPARECGWLELRNQDGSATRLLPSARPPVRVSQLAPAPGGPAERELSNLARSLIGLQLAGIGHDGEGPDLLAERCSAALDRAARISRSGELDSASELPGQLATLCDVLTGQHPDGSLSPAWSGMLDAALQTDGPSRHLDIAAGLPPVNGTTVRLDSLVSEPGTWRIYLRAYPRWQARSDDQQREWAPVSAHARDDLGGNYLSTFGGSTGHADHEELTLQFQPRLNPAAHALTLTFSSAHQQAAVDLELVPAARPKRERSR
jgi:hypothetical protein